MTMYDDDDPDGAAAPHGESPLASVEPMPGAYRMSAEGETEMLIRQAAVILQAAQKVPLSSSSMVNKEELLELLEEALVRLPDELREARWLLKERAEFLERREREGEELIAVARKKAELMVQRTEVVQAAERRARSIVDAAEAEARRLRHEVEDFVDQKLASFENVLERTAKMVQAGREKMQVGARVTSEAALAAAPLAGDDEGPFDQDAS